MIRTDIAPGMTIGDDSPLVVIAGPCVLQTEEAAIAIGAHIKAVCADLGLGYIFKASFDKANRTSAEAFRGPLLTRGLQMLGTVKRELGVPITTDIHESDQAEAIAEVADVIQIPAFLSRQTDLLTAAARTGKAVNVKKGQYLAPWDMVHVVNKLTGAGATNIVLTERGTSFGYNNLIVDFRALVDMRALGYPVVFDASHSLQDPGGLGSSSGGRGELIPNMARAAAAVGIDGLFFEVHPEPDSAPSDGPTSLRLDAVSSLLESVCRVRAAAGRH